MAKELLLRVWDDLDQTTQATQIDVPLGWAGQIYLLDLSDSSFEALEAALLPFLKAAHSTQKWPKNRQPKKTPEMGPGERGGVAARAHAVPDRNERQRIRAWGRANGFEVKARGFLANDLQEAYAKAHKDGRKRG